MIENGIFHLVTHHGCIPNPKVHTNGLSIPSQRWLRKLASVSADQRWLGTAESYTKTFSNAKNLFISNGKSKNVKFITYFHKFPGILYSLFVLSLLLLLRHSFHPTYPIRMIYGPAANGYDVWKKYTFIQNGVEKSIFVCLKLDKTQVRFWLYLTDSVSDVIWNNITTTTAPASGAYTPTQSHRIQRIDIGKKTIYHYSVQIIDNKHLKWIKMKL